MFVYFNNFWNGFLEETDPVNVLFFIKLLSSVYSTEIHYTTNVNNADILVESIFGNHSYIHHKSWVSTFLFTGESYYSDFAKQNMHLYTCVLGFQKTQNNMVECPLFIPYILCNSYQYEPIDSIPPNHAVSVVISNGTGYVRNLFLEKLEQKMNLLYGGHYKNNIGGSIQGSYHSNNIINFYKTTRFVVTMENSREEHYVTEKIINGFRAGTIPIYWGSPHITKYFNPKRFLLLDTVTDDAISTLIDKMIAMSDQEYLSIIHEPIFNISVDSLFDDMVISIKTIIGK